MFAPQEYKALILLFIFSPPKGERLFF